MKKKKLSCHVSEISFARRMFLKDAGIAAVGIGLTGCMSMNTPAVRNDGGDDDISVTVMIEGSDDPFMRRILTILADRIQRRCQSHVVEVDNNAQLILAVDGELSCDAFCIADTGTSVRISGGTPRGVLYGVGKFLRTSSYDGHFVPSSWRGTSVPQGNVRGMYFATHFHNWYHQAPEEEITRYMEDLALWGVNAVMVIFPMINLRDWNDPQAEPAMAMVLYYAKIARALGIQFVTGINNAFFIDAPESIRATPLPDPTRRRGNSGHPICPSNPDGHTYIMENTRRLYEKLSEAGLDILCFWPYDEGGCACEKCRPWGANGYLRLSCDQAALARQYFPNLKTILSTWMYDTPPEGEWQALTDYVASEGHWIDYILADSHEDFPRYPLDIGVPGKRPLLNFPEISMWGNWPWGGFGAHPLPSRFQRLWDQVKQSVSGGFPYSEGIYEDMNKAVVLQFYWNRDQSARITLEEYIGYEFSPAVIKEVLAIIDILESAAGSFQRKEHPDNAAVLRACELAEIVDARLPEWAQKNWRWEILRLRTILDRERFAGDGLETPAAEEAMIRLIEIYHCQLETDDPYHHRVRPPLRRALSRGGEH